MKTSRKRLFIDKKTAARERSKLINLALENECNTLVFSLDDPFFINRNQKYIQLIKTYPVNIEAGGHNLSLLLPKHLFLFNRDLFRMEQGRRKQAHHFCPTNPKSIEIIAAHAFQLLTRTLYEVTTPRIYHLMPDKGYENIWCQCPACRAFRPGEQYLIVVNTVADVLAKLDPEAKLMYIDFDTEPEAARIMPRKNTSVL